MKFRRYEKLSAPLPDKVFNLKCPHCEQFICSMPDFMGICSVGNVLDEMTDEEWECKKAQIRGQILETTFHIVWDEIKNHECS